MTIAEAARACGQGPEEFAWSFARYAASSGARMACFYDRSPRYRLSSATDDEVTHVEAAAVDKYLAAAAAYLMRCDIARDVGILPNGDWEDS
jgi:hypothetical protein